MKKGGYEFEGQQGRRVGGLKKNAVIKTQSLKQASKQSKTSQDMAL